ncbi:uncharacterized protein APUU_20366A [Aspergillus puulaauensis]|uniref:Uncharacterized protein n=1 Tax=Aspergillus puulaauensis TaxID=1220207 RepID=A0A7R7XEU7_9EURO|nr:uncharacterized protein APUU_20366A [Aspergillus puulaauensis]BCS19933.1 hypothetical protein APUU_20366A [Aspergillus puulaauensis]
MPSKPEWILAPADIQPNTTITLGKLIVNPLTPEGPPYLDPALPIPPGATTEFNYPWTREVSHERSGMVGLFGSFMANVGLGGDVSAQFDRQHKSRVEVARLQTVKFEPGDEYLEKTLNGKLNLRYLKESGFRKSIYVVTGVKVAYGGKTTVSKGRGTGGEGNLGISPGVPGLELGPKAGLSWKNEESEEIGEPIDFVYAFRLNKVRYSRRRERFVQKYTKGIVFSQPISFDPRNVAEPEVVPEVVPVQSEYEIEDEGVELLRLEEISQDEFGITGQEVLDEGGEACTLLAP